MNQPWHEIDHCYQNIPKGILVEFWDSYEERPRLLIFEGRDSHNGNLLFKDGTVWYPPSNCPYLTHWKLPTSPPMCVLAKLDKSIEHHESRVKALKALYGVKNS